MPKLDANRVNEGLSRIAKHEARAPILSPADKTKLTSILQQDTVSAGDLHAAGKILDKALVDANKLMKDVTQMKGWSQQSSWVFDYEGAFQSLKNAVDDGKKQTVAGQLKTAADGLVDKAVDKVSTVLGAFALLRGGIRF